jgi:hypothetical protein
VAAVYVFAARAEGMGEITAVESKPAGVLSDEILVNGHHGDNGTVAMAIELMTEDAPTTAWTIRFADRTGMRATKSRSAREDPQRRVLRALP